VVATVLVHMIDTEGTDTEEVMGSLPLAGCGLGMSGAA
jgi:hypothetical protein